MRQATAGTGTGFSGKMEALIDVQVCAPRSQYRWSRASSWALLQPALGAELRTSARAVTFHWCAGL